MDPPSFSNPKYAVTSIHTAVEGDYSGLVRQILRKTCNSIEISFQANGSSVAKWYCKQGDRKQ
jgi:hypothetical protein